MLYTQLLAVSLGKVTASFGVTHFLGDDNRDRIVKRADDLCR